MSINKWGRIKVRQGWTPPDSECCITAPGSASVWREGRGAGRGLINECYWVVESLCPHSPSCHRDTQWLHQFVAIITSIGKNGGRRGVEDYGERRLLLHHLWVAEQGAKQDVITSVGSKICQLKVAKGLSLRSFLKCCHTNFPLSLAGIKEKL